jgi:hypothetical protein
MYKQPRNQEKHERQLGGVIANFAGTRFEEAKSRAHEFVQGPLQWLQVNQPIRKAVLLEGLDIFRPGVEVSHEHEIQKWKRGVKRVGGS